ncbi:MAG: DUF1833 domain-containing protein [Heliobacteriaceae bacterium]|jgi:hypothetical protein|nr:DUF1833 domain-containing protein [Heliobacteriaceae bacterium]
MSRFELDKNAFSRGLGRSINMLIEVSHSLFDETFYFINDTKPLTVDTQTYQPFPFDIRLPNQTETQGTQIVIANVNNLVSNELRKTISSNENILLYLKLANIEKEEAETYECGEFELTGLSITNEAVSAQLNIRNCFEINAGTIRYNRQLFANIYK